MKFNILDYIYNLIAMATIIVYSAPSRCIAFITFTAVGIHGPLIT